MTCTANFRTNSFVGTEGSRSHLIGNLICWIWTHFRVHCSGGYCCTRSHGGSGLVDIGDPYIWDDSTCFEKSLFLWRGCWRTIFLFAIPLGLKYATTPFKGTQRDETFHNIRYQAVQFRDSPRLSSWVEGVMRGHEKSAHQPFLFNKEIRLANAWIIKSRAGKDCVNRLLDKHDRTRLGSKSGASEVKQHKWFGKINWGLLRNTRPPVRWCSVFVFCFCFFPFFFLAVLLWHERGDYYRLADMFW